MYYHYTTTAAHTLSYIVPVPLFVQFCRWLDVNNPQLTAEHDIAETDEALTYSSTPVIVTTNKKTVAVTAPNKKKYALSVDKDGVQPKQSTWYERISRPTITSLPVNAPKAEHHSTVAQQEGYWSKWRGLGNKPAGPIVGPERTTVLQRHASGRFGIVLRCVGGRSIMLKSEPLAIVVEGKLEIGDIITSVNNWYFCFFHSRCF